MIKLYIMILLPYSTNKTTLYVQCIINYNNITKLITYTIFYTVLWLRVYSDITNKVFSFWVKLSITWKLIFAFPESSKQFWSAMYNVHTDTYLIHFKNLQNLVQGQQNILHCRNISLCSNGTIIKCWICYTWSKGYLSMNQDPC